MFPPVRFLLLLSIVFVSLARAAAAPNAFIEQYCADCHDGDSKKGGLDLTALAWELDKRENFDEWVKVVDLMDKGEMPPKKKSRPDAKAAHDFMATIGNELRAFESGREAETRRAVLRRVNRL